MLRSFDREDLETLWKLVKAKHGYTRLEGGYERVLWGDLNTMFEHHVEYLVWRNLQGNKLLVWKLFDSCGVYFASFLSSSQSNSRINEVFGSILLIRTVNGEVQLQALVDGNKIIITEATIRRDLQLEDAKGIDCLPNADIFEQLTLMGAKTTSWNEFSSTIASAIICLATNQKFNFSKYIFESMVKNLDNDGKFLMYSRFVQVFLDNQLEGMATHNRIYIAPSHTKKIFASMRRQEKDFPGRVTPLFPTMVVQAQEEMGEGLEMSTDPHHIPITTQPSSSQPQRKQKSRRSKRKDTELPQPSDPINVADEAVNEEPSMQLKELIDFCTKLSARVVSSDEASLGDQEDASKQGRKIVDIDADAEITLVDKTPERYRDEDMFGVHDLDGDEVVVESEVCWE
ncbi:hypothetical protein Tco_0770034 [Tanacetum coccineum]|uniref:Uncharacterized protein n=1 Tax=Tanacetum coccineum TaxID=301880 RepID=A0ABQ4ZEX4_9ASTR